MFADECLFMFSHVLCYYDVHMKTIGASSSSFIINQNSTTVLYCFFGGGFLGVLVLVLKAVV